MFDEARKEMSQCNPWWMCVPNSGRFCQSGDSHQNFLVGICSRELESRAMATQARNASESDPIMERLEDQISWYDRKSLMNQRTYKRVKVLEIFAAGAIPILASLRFSYSATSVFSGILISILGVLILVLEFLLLINKYQETWTKYRSTCETLKHEKFLYLAKAGPYGLVDRPESLLAERIESLVSQEHAKWASERQQK